jgi:signal transduction histidine kinase
LSVHTKSKKGFGLIALCVFACTVAAWQWSQETPHGPAKKADALALYGDSVHKVATKLVSIHQHEAALQSLGKGLLALDEYHKLDAWIRLSFLQAEVQKLVGMRPQAIETYATIAPVLSSQADFAKLYNRKAAVYVEAGQYDSCLYYVQLSERAARTLQKPSAELTVWNWHLAGVAYMASNPASAKKYLTKAYNLALTADTQNVSILLSQLAVIEQRAGNYTEAKSLFTQAANRALEQNAVLNHLWVFEGLAYVCHKLGHEAEAYRWLAQKDSLRNLINPDGIVVNLKNLAEEVALTRLKKAQTEANQQRTVAEARTQLALASLLFLCLLCALLARALARVRNQKLLLSKAYSTLDELADGLSTKTTALLAADAHKNMLLGVIGHDVRTPLSNLKTLIALLKSKDITLKDVDAMIGQLEHDVDQARTMLDDLLLWAKAQMEGLKPSSASHALPPLVKRILYHLQPQANEVGVTFALDDGVDQQAWINDGLLQIVVRNILSNAIEHSPKGGQVSIVFGATPNFCTLQITNSCVAMGAASRAILMGKDGPTAPLHKNEDASRGFGLVIVRDFLQLMQGHATVHIPDGGGTAVTIHLPMAPTQPKPKSVLAMAFTSKQA